MSCTLKRTSARAKHREWIKCDCFVFQFYNNDDYNYEAIVLQDDHTFVFQMYGNDDDDDHQRTLQIWHQVLTVRRI